MFFFLFSSYTVVPAALTMHLLLTAFTAKLLFTKILVNIHTLHD